MRRLIYALCFVLLCAGAAHAQTASLSGLITDPSGAVVPQASVELREQATGVKMETESNAAGVYTFPFVKPGVYAVTIQKPGFRTLTQPGVTLTVAQDARINFALQVGAATQTVEVMGGAVQVNTTDAAVSTVVDRHFVENLPLNGRSFQSLLYMTPGVNLNVGAGLGGYAQGQFVVNGQRADANYWIVDGVSGNVGTSTGLTGVNGSGMGGAIGGVNVLGGTSALVSVDDMQEFRIETSTYAPEFGRSPGGQISIVTRSGTNQFHGTAFDYLRNTVLDASDWFADANGLHKAREIQNDFGGALGGPIKKDKAFFFFSYEGLRVVQPETFIGTVPDLATRQAAIPAVRPYLNAYPLPKPGAVDVGPGYVPYSAAFSNPGSADATSIRIDYQLANKLSLFGRFSDAPSSAEQRGGNGQWSANSVGIATGLTRTLTVGTTWTASSNVVNEVRFNYSTAGGSTRYRTDNFGGAGPFPTEGILAPGFTLQDSSVVPLPLVGTAMGQLDGFIDSNFQHQYNVVDTLSVQRGSHSLKFGVDYRRLTPYHLFAKEQILPLFLNMSDYAAGNPFVWIVIQDIPGTFLLNNLGAFAQDSWRVNSRLNLTYGLRWDVDFRPSTVQGPNFTGLTGFSLTNLSNLALGPAGTPPYSTRYGNVAPRIGGAYQLRKSPNWGLTLRGGFGVFYSLASTELGNAAVYHNDYPWGAAAFPSAPFPSAPPVPPVVPPNIQNGYELIGFDPHLNLPYALEWSAALEQSLGRAQTLTLSYIGSSDKRVIASESILNPNPNYAAANLIGNTGTSSYNALQVKYQRAMGKGLQALGSYTWSHCIDDGSYGGYVNGTLANASANRGDCDYDLRHVFTAGLTYNFPALNNNAFTRAITGGWSVDNIVQIRTGPPIDITDANFTSITQVSQAQSSVVIRPDVVPGQPFYLNGSQYPGGRALNPAAFTNPPVDPSTGVPLRQGDLGRNAVRALGLTEWDFAVRRQFTIHENIKLQFRADLFNVLNHPNFGPFNNSFLTGNTFFGQATSMLNQYLGLGGGPGSGTQNPLYTPGGPRTGELALKLIF